MNSIDTQKPKTGWLEAIRNVVINVIVIVVGPERYGAWSGGPPPEPPNDRVRAFILFVLGPILIAILANLVTPYVREGLEVLKIYLIA